MRTALLLASFAALLTGAAAQASNDLYILPGDDVHNAADVTATGDGNALTIQQSYTGSGGRNTVSLGIVGDLNGGPLGWRFDTRIFSGSLTPGMIEQSGYDNSIGMTVAGSANLFSISQSGSANTLTASVVGNYNQAAIAQYGSGNSVTFVQNGFGNVLSVIQRSQ